MAHDGSLRDVLFIPKHHQKCVSLSRYICLVHEDWLKSLHQKTLQECPKAALIGRDDASLFLAPSHQTLPKYWKRISVKIVQKFDQPCKLLRNGPLCNTSRVTTCTEHLAQTARENFSNLWSAAHMHYTTQPMDTVHHMQDKFSNVLRSYLQRLKPEVYITLPDNHQIDELPSNHTCYHDKMFGNNAIPTFAVIETMSTFYIIQPYIAYSLWDIVAYSPAVFESSHAKCLFVLYQILQAMQSFHRIGLSVGDLLLDNVRIDEKLWVYCTYPSIPGLFKDVSVKNQVEYSSSVINIGKDTQSNDLESNYTEELNVSSVEGLIQSGSMSECDSEVRLERKLSRLSDKENFMMDALDVMDEFQVINLSLDNLASITEQWVHYKMSNFRYLMYLNYLAGRRLGDPNHHPVIPWVMDFTSTHSGLRDLTMSKFRLNKGDSQLDFTFEAMGEIGGDSEHIPHHVSDVLSDITYYLYKARRTPKHLLCTYVRTKWVPNEYPSSIERMYQWTPDECIPEFFTDPTIFTSIHEDLPDLELPSWCSSAPEFVERHLAMLESEQVSCDLHHWIDTTFGFKLSGYSAIKCKNVYLHLVDGHRTVQNHGVVQMFPQPHPHRLPFTHTLSLLPIRVRKPQTMHPSSSKATLSDRDVEHSLIKLPDDFDPTAALDHLEALHSFTLKTADRLPPNCTGKKKVEMRFTELHDNMGVVWRDIQQFACLMCELCLGNQLLALTRQASLRERYNTIGRLWSRDKGSLPRIIHTAAEILLNLENFKEQDKETDTSGLLFEYPMVNSLGLPPPTPALLVQPSCNVLPFPPYFGGLYELINNMKNIDKDVSYKLNQLKSAREKNKVEKILLRKKVEILELYLRKNSGRISDEGFEILLPYIRDLFEDPVTTVQAAWSILGHVGRELGPAQLAKNLMPCLIRIYSGEDSTPKHMKLYHRSFLVQLLLHLGLESFLSNFSTLLVEAVAGYKNFVVIPHTSQDDMEEEKEEEGFPSNSDHHSSHQDEAEDQINEEIPECEENDDEQDPMQVEDEDVRPDQREDEQPDYLGDYAEDDDVTELEGAFPSLILGHHNKSEDSFSTDRMSQQSYEYEANRDDDSGRTDPSSSDKASVHSISHILDMSEDSSRASQEPEDTSEERKMKHSHSVHFEMEEELYGGRSQLNTSTEHQNDQEKAEVVENGEEESKLSSFMIRSETDEFQQIHYSHTINICDVAAESIKWLSHRLGPLLTAKFLSKNLVRMLALCYLAEEQIEPVHEQCSSLAQSTRQVQGDSNAHKVLECLSYVACIYGEQVILIQYLPCITDMIHVARKRLTIRAEAGLVAAVVLLRSMLPLLTDKTFMQVLLDSVIRDALRPILKLVSSASTAFPSGASMRSLILYKIIDLMYIIGLRLGFENTRRFLTPTLQMFFAPFDQVYSTMDADGMWKSCSSEILKDDTSSVDESYLNIKMDTVTNQVMIGSPVNINTSPRPTDHVKKWRAPWLNYSLTDIHTMDDRDEVDGRSTSQEILLSEFRQTYSPELALAAYIPLTSVFGSHHMEGALPNDDLIRRLCAQYDSALYSDNNEDPTGPVPSDMSPADLSGTQADTDLGSNVALVGNQLCLQEDPAPTPSPEVIRLRPHAKHRGILRIDPEDTRSDDLEHKNLRHLKGNWLAYWEHELGLNERDTLFNFKQIKLQTFQGHTNSIRCITRLDNENSFISASKDKTVKLWSIQSFGDGTGRCRSQFSYNLHKKSVFSVAYMENQKLVASCDSTVHVWDPFTGDPVRQLESQKYSPVIALAPIPGPSTVVVTATTDNTLRFLDMRSARYAHEYKCVIGSHGLIRNIATSPDGSWVAVGFSAGVISLLSLHTGILLGTWKAHDGEILQLKAHNKTSFLSTAFDLTMKLWPVDGSTKELCSFRGHTEPVHCVNFYKNQIVSASTSNKIGVHTAVDTQANFTSTKLRSEVFKGVLTSMEILPLNRSLLLGADNGLIRLIC
ncbi:WD repeat-containing protein 81-like isoform X2 [Mya arenaria]|uniref:WD repeat-containing protein 81-like isoform X2 n=1 Tax=Mya arenaria TaxID=6604 RepID=UPI0022E585DE|nr:WD repeat-containing protein 81-like isoform X2 [Mya arenaria]